ncbi:MAG: hypothetical protein HYX41_03775 [Bdellovibrio sp.]|nr:hypothetical protein [Bdellovibrio sp.]
MIIRKFRSVLFITTLMYLFVGTQGFAVVFKIGDIVRTADGRVGKVIAVVNRIVTVQLDGEGTGQSTAQSVLKRHDFDLDADENAIKKSQTPDACDSRTAATDISEVSGHLARDSSKAMDLIDPISDIQLGNAPDPAPIHFNKNSSECQTYIKAMQCLCGEEFKEDAERAQLLLNSVKYVSFEELQTETRKSIEHFKAQIENRPFLLIHGPIDKSSAWLTQKFANFLPQGNFRVRNYDDDLSRYWKAHPECKDVLIFDDAIYSGSQIRGIAFGIKKICPDCQFHAIVPYTTLHGKEIVEKEASPLFQVHIYSNHIVDSPEQQIKRLSTPNTLEKNMRLIQETKGLQKGQANFFFQHKIADDLSTIDFLRLRSVHCGGKTFSLKKKNSKGTPIKVIIPCIPFIQIPYKAGYDGVQIRELSLYEEFHDEMSNEVREMLEHYDAGRCEDWRKTR